MVIGKRVLARVMAALASVALVATVSLASGAVSLASSAATTPVYGGTLQLATQNQPSFMDPARCEEIICAQFVYLEFNTLVAYAPTSTKIVPSLATHWTVSPDGKTYTFYLRKGVTFSNGDPFTAQDVVYTFTRLNEAATSAPYQGAFGNLVGAAALLAGKTSTLSGIQAVGNYEVVMHLSAPQAFWLNVLALPSASIVDPKVAADWNAIYAGKAKGTINPVGTGPFILEPYGASPTNYTFVKNPHFWEKGLPYLDKIHIQVGPDPQLQLEMFQRGRIDAIPGFLDNVYLDPAVYLDVLKSPTLKSEYIEAPDIGFGYLFMNPTIKPFNNLDLRLAITYALNKAFIDRVLTNGRGGVANSILPPGMPGYSASLNPLHLSYTPTAALHNQAMARAYLKKAGYPNGLNIGNFIVIQGPGDTQLAGLVSSELKAVGITCTPKILAGNVYVQEAVSGDKLGFAQSAWFQDYPDPQDFLFNLFDSHEIGGNNFVHYSNPTVDKLVETADGMPDSQMAARIKLYQQAENIILKSAVVIPLNWEWQDGLIAKNLYPKNPLIWLHPVDPSRLDMVWIAK